MELFNQEYFDGAPPTQSFQEVFVIFQRTVRDVLKLKQVDSDHRGWFKFKTVSGNFVTLDTSMTYGWYHPYYIQSTVDLAAVTEALRGTPLEDGFIYVKE